MVTGNTERELRIFLSKPLNPHQDNEAKALEWVVECQMNH